MKVMRLAPAATTYADEKQVDALLANLLEGYCATVDVPANLLTPELMRTFPDAIVIATTRDSAAWYRSVCRMTAMTNPLYVHVAVYWIPNLGGFHRHLAAMQRMFVWRFGHKDLLLSDLARHEDMLRECVPAERLVWYDCRDGWEPLCRALNVPIPQQPFPHNNKPDEAARVFRSVMILGLSLWAGVLGVFSAGGYLMWKRFLA